MSSGKYCEMKISFNDLSDVSSEDGCGDHDHSTSSRQPAVLPPSIAAEAGSCSRFMLSDDGWIVEEVPRRDASRVDKYYYEPGTGRKFRSPKEVERYFKGEPVRSKVKVLCGHNERSRNSKYSKYIMRGGKAIKLDEGEGNKKQLSIVNFNANAGMSITDLPDGWIIEDVPRRSCSRRYGSSYKNYYEPGTGRKFRSLVEIQRHLDEDIPLSTYTEDHINEILPLSTYIEDQINEILPLSMKFNMYHKKKVKFVRSCDANVMMPSFPRPCKEVKWILGGSSSGGDVWYPFSIEVPVSGSVKWVPVPGSVKEQWKQRFMEVMNGVTNQNI